MGLSPFRSLRPAGTCTPLRARDWPEAGRRVASGERVSPPFPQPPTRGDGTMSSIRTPPISPAPRCAPFSTLSHTTPTGAAAMPSPSQARIADHAGVHVRTVRRALGKLQELGLIVRTRRRAITARPAGRRLAHHAGSAKTGHAVRSIDQTTEKTTGSARKEGRRGSRLGHPRLSVRLGHGSKSGANPRSGRLSTGYAPLRVSRP